jgi:hypothetical protein
MNSAELNKDDVSPRTAEHLLQVFLNAKFRFEHLLQFQSPWTLRFNPLGYTVCDMLLTLFELYALYGYGGNMYEIYYF